MTFDTEYYESLPSGRVAKMGGEIEAGSWPEAERLAAAMGHTVFGQRVMEIDAPEMAEFCEGVIAGRDRLWAGEVR